MKLKRQYFGHQMRRADSLEKTLMLGKTEDKRRGRQRIRWLDSITNSTDVNLSKLREIVKDRGDWCAAVHWGFKEADITQRPNNNHAIQQPDSYESSQEKLKHTSTQIEGLWQPCTVK